MSVSPVRPGLELLLEERSSLLSGSRVALLAHAASVDRRLRHAADLLAAHPGIELVRLFGPEHGVQGAAQDMEAVAGEAPARDLPVVSLYGDSETSLHPPPGSLDDVDVLVVDLQDVGARYYTYAATAAYAAAACARASVRLVVADRPNPLGGVEVEGEGVEPGFGSFVGAFDLPARHGLTLGELLLWQRRQAGLDLELDVVHAEGWRREASYEETGLPWVLPSPNMPTLDTARVYPGACLVEGTNLSEGRGTTLPFELAGAPFLAGASLARALEAEGLPGALFRPCLFRPTSGKWRGSDCGGVQIHVTDPAAFRPLRTGLSLLAAARRLAPEAFAWRSEPYEFVTDRPAIDLLAGNSRWRRHLDAGGGAAEIAAAWPEREAAWREEREDLLLYRP
jgi:uncharacterized protein YbbC (DUF1343 family)